MGPRPSGLLHWIRKPLRTCYLRSRIPAFRNDLGYQWYIGGEGSCWEYCIWWNPWPDCFHLLRFSSAVESQKPKTGSDASTAICLSVSGIWQIHSILWQWSKPRHLLFRYSQMVVDIIHYFPISDEYYSLCYSIDPWEKRWSKMLNTRMYVSISLFDSDLSYKIKWLYRSEPWWKTLVCF